MCKFAPLQNFLHLHEIVEGSYFYFSLSLCVCVCVCVCVCLSVCEQNADQTATPILTLNSCLLQSLEPYWNWWPWVKGQVTKYPFFLHNSLLTSLLGILALLCPIKMKFSLLLMPLVDLCLNLMIFEWVVTSLWRHLSFLQVIVNFSNLI